jgi:hypothetical protein
MKLYYSDGEVWYNRYWHGEVGGPIANWLITLAELSINPYEAPNPTMAVMALEGFGWTLPTTWEA